MRLLGPNKMFFFSFEYQHCELYANTHAFKLPTLCPLLTNQLKILALEHPQWHVLIVVHATTQLKSYGMMDGWLE